MDKLDSEWRKRKCNVITNSKRNLSKGRNNVKKQTRKVNKQMTKALRGKVLVKKRKYRKDVQKNKIISLIMLIRKKLLLTLLSRWYKL